MLAATHISHQLLRQRIEAISLAIVISVLIFELIRRKHMMERYAILWLLAGITVLVLALWKGLLGTLSHAAGISYGPSALFAVTFLFVLGMLVQFSVTISRLSAQNTMLAQRLALMQQRIEEQPDRQGEQAAGGESPARDLPAGDSPSGQTTERG